MLARPRTALAQQTERPRSVGILMPLREDDPQSQLRIAAFSQILRQIGWMDGRTIALEKRFSDGDPERLAGLALDLVQKPVDVIVTQAAQPVEAVRKATTSIPIVMASVGDAVGAGYVGSLAHPGGNITGFTTIDFPMIGKWLDMLRDVIPDIQAATLPGSHSSPPIRAPNDCSWSKSLSQRRPGLPRLRMQMPADIGWRLLRCDRQQQSWDWLSSRSR